VIFALGFSLGLIAAFAMCASGASRVGKGESKAILRAKSAALRTVGETKAADLLDQCIREIDGTAEGDT
jgi:hypothetical protein